MKTIITGIPPTPERPKWWVGKRAKCRSCEGVFELEATDNPAVFNNRAEMSCPTAGCGFVLWFMA